MSTLAPYKPLSIQRTRYKSIHLENLHGSIDTLKQLADFNASYKIKSRQIAPAALSPHICTR